MKPKILIVEHDSANIKLIHDELEKSKINITSKIVQTKKEYKNAIHNFKPDVILSHYTFPAFDGPAAFKISKALSPETPFIFVSESIGEETAIEWIKNGVSDFVLKASLSSLPTKMSRALKEAKAITLNFQKQQAEEKRIEKLSYNAQKYYSVIESSMDAIFLSYEDGSILEANAAACEIFQMTREEICKSKISDMVDSTDPRQQVLVQELKKTGKIRGELTFKRKEGSRFQGEIISVVFTDADGLEKTSITIKDVSERKLAELALKASESFSKGVLDSLNSHIAVINSKGTILKVNKSWNTFAQDNGGNTTDKFGEGANYFDACIDPNFSTDDNTFEVIKGIKDVLAGLSNEYHYEYPCHSPVTQRWFNMTAKIFESSETLVLIEHHDITDQKLAELKQILTSNALEESLKERNKILDSSLDIICSVDEDGRFISVNAASEYVWGYTPDELLGRKYIDFVLEEDTKITLEEAVKIKSNMPITNFENSYRHKNGRVVPMLWTSQWVEKDKKSYAVAKDVTEKKRLEKAFEIERQQFLDLYSQAPSCMGILKGPNYVYEMANPLYLQLIDKKDIIGKTVKEVLPELEAQGIFCFLDSVYHTGKSFSANEMPVQFDFYGNGNLVDTYLNFIYQAHRNSEGAIDGILFFAIDVTEQVLSRKKIEESEKKYRFLFENNPMPMWIIDDISSRFLAVNEMAILQYGYSRKEFLSMTAIDIRPEEDKERFIKFNNSDEIINTDYNSEIWDHLRKDGTVITVEIIAQKIIYEGVKAHFILSNDITDRKKAELNLEKQNEELAFHYKEKEIRAAELIITNNELLKTNSELDRFVYSVSHDLRSPLTSILGVLSFIEEESQEPETLKHAEMIHKSVNRMDDFIKNILSYSRNNRTGLEIEKISIQETALAIVDSLQSMTEAKEIHYEIDIQEHQPFYSDALRFNTILENLISNAIKHHTKSKSGRYVKITGESDQDKLKFTVADNGIGIAPEHHIKIFDMFCRLSGDTDGSGIGLYIVKDAVKKMQGTLEIQSEKGIGTTFTITLKNLKP